MGRLFGRLVLGEQTPSPLKDRPLSNYLKGKQKENDRDGENVHKPSCNENTNHQKKKKTCTNQKALRSYYALVLLHISVLLFLKLWCANSVCCFDSSAAQHLSSRSASLWLWYPAACPSPSSEGRGGWSSSSCYVHFTFIIFHPLVSPRPLRQSLLTLFFLLPIILSFHPSFSALFSLLFMLCKNNRKSEIVPVCYYLKNIFQGINHHRLELKFKSRFPLKIYNLHAAWHLKI